MRLKSEHQVLQSSANTISVMSSFNKWGGGEGGVGCVVTTAWYHGVENWARRGLRVTPHFCGGRGEGGALLLVFARATPLRYHWHLIVDGMHTSTDVLFFFPLHVAVASTMSDDCTRIRPVPGTDNNATHWSSHTNAATASTEGRTCWKNVKHPGNPPGPFWCGRDPVKAWIWEGPRATSSTTILKEWIHFFFLNCKKRSSCCFRNVRWMCVGTRMQTNDKMWLI